MGKLIRLARPCDANEIAAIYAPFVTGSAASFELIPPDGKEFEKRIDEKLAKWPWLVCVINNRIAGYAYAGEYRSRAAYQWSVEASVYIHPEFHRRGIGRAPYTSLFGMLARQGFYTGYAGITQPNEASTRFHQSMGFEYIGVYRAAGYKHGQWRDVSWWYRPLQDKYDHPPKPVFAPSELIDDERWMNAMNSGCKLIR